jgi:hypothetical protein
MLSKSTIDLLLVPLITWSKYRFLSLKFQSLLFSTAIRIIFLDFLEMFLVVRISILYVWTIGALGHGYLGGVVINGK